MKVKSYEDLLVWQKGVEFVKEIYSLTSRFPKEEIFGLTAQIRRAVVSIPSNIAEGFMRQHKPEIVQFLFIALGSCGEVHTQLVIAKELGFIDDQILKRLVVEYLFYISKMLRNLIKSLREKND